jgi:hypothetical protein
VTVLVPKFLIFGNLFSILEFLKDKIRRCSEFSSVLPNLSELAPEIGVRMQKTSKMK